MHHQKVQHFFHTVQSSNLEFLNSWVDKVGARSHPRLADARRHSPLCYMQKGNTNQNSPMHFIKTFSFPEDIAIF